MAVNKSPYLKNIFGAPGPFRVKCLFQAGGTQAIKRGELLMPNTSDNWIPMDADQEMCGTVVIADEEIASGDRAGYYWCIAPQPGDVFEFELATAAAVAYGDLLFYSTSQKLTTTGTHPVAVVIGQENVPKQGHLSVDASDDAGTTVRSVSYAQCMILPNASYFNAVANIGNTFSIVKECTAGGSEDEVVLEEALYPFRVVSGHIIERDTNNVNVYCKTSTGTFTDTIATGGTDDVIVRFTKLIAEYDNVVKGDSIAINFSGAGSVTVVLDCVRM